MLTSDSDQAQTNAWRDFLNSILTEPMTIIELADHFEISRKKMASILDHMEGVEKLPGRMVRIPLNKMPPGYLIDKGLLIPESL